jgi:hypothetical protein
MPAGSEAPVAVGADSSDPVALSSRPSDAAISQPTEAQRKLSPEDIALLRRAISDLQLPANADPRFQPLANDYFQTHLNPDEYTIDHESNLKPWWYYTFKIAFGLYALVMVVRMSRARSAAKKAADAMGTS